MRAIITTTFFKHTEGRENDKMVLEQNLNISRKKLSREEEKDEEIDGGISFTKTQLVWQVIIFRFFFLSLSLRLLVFEQESFVLGKR